MESHEILNENPQSFHFESGSMPSLWLHSLKTFLEQKKIIEDYVSNRCYSTVDRSHESSDENYNISVTCEGDQLEDNDSQSSEENQLVLSEEWLQFVESNRQHRLEHNKFKESYHGRKQVTRKNIKIKLKDKLNKSDHSMKEVKEFAVKKNNISNFKDNLDGSNNDTKEVKELVTKKNCNKSNSKGPDGKKCKQSATMKLLYGEQADTVLQTEMPMRINFHRLYQKKASIPYWPVVPLNWKVYFQ